MNWIIYIAITTENAYTWYALTGDDNQLKIINCRHYVTKDGALKSAIKFLEKSGIKGRIED